MCMCECVCVWVFHRLTDIPTSHQSTSEDVVQYTWGRKFPPFRWSNASQRVGPEKDNFIRQLFLLFLSSKFLLCVSWILKSPTRTIGWIGGYVFASKDFYNLFSEHIFFLGVIPWNFFRVWILKKHLLCYQTNPLAYFFVHVLRLTLPKMAWLGFFPLIPMPGPGIELASAGSIATSTQGTLPTELPRPRNISKKHQTQRQLGLVRSKMWLIASSPFQWQIRYHFFRNKALKPILLSLVETSVIAVSNPLAFIPHVIDSIYINNPPTVG